MRIEANHTMHLKDGWLTRIKHSIIEKEDFYSVLDVIRTNRLCQQKLESLNPYDCINHKVIKILECIGYVCQLKSKITPFHLDQRTEESLVLVILSNINNNDRISTN